MLAGVVTGVNHPGIKFWVDIVRGETDFGFWPEIRVRQVLVFTPLINTLFQHGFKGAKTFKNCQI